jgi:Flp pilus assembly protein TadG
MKKSLRHPNRRVRGSVAIEFALLLPVMMLLLAAPLLFGRVFWHYTVAQKAAQDAVRFLASASAAEIRTSGAGGSEAPVAAVARAIVQAEIAELNPGPTIPGVSVQCDGQLCYGGIIPTNVTVTVQIFVSDTVFSGFTDQFTGGGDIVINPVASTNYVGN